MCTDDDDVDSPVMDCVQRQLCSLIQTKLFSVATAKEIDCGWTLGGPLLRMLRRQFSSSSSLMVVGRAS
jgi:hypothetical protein